MFKEVSREGVFSTCVLSGKVQNEDLLGLILSQGRLWSGDSITTLYLNYRFI